MSPEPSLMQQGLQLLYFGMGTVVVFLSLLVLCTSLMSYLVKYFGLDRAAPARRAGRPSSAEPSPELSPNVIAAISAAIHEHRRQ